MQGLDIRWHRHAAEADQALPCRLVADQDHASISRCLCLGQLAFLILRIGEDGMDIGIARLDGGERTFVAPAPAIVAWVERPCNQAGSEGRHVRARN